MSQQHPCSLLDLDISDAHYKLFFENFLEGALLSLPSGEILDANPAICKLLGYTKEELIQGGRHLILDANDHTLAMGIERRAHSGKFKGELTFIRKGGVKIPCEVFSSLFQDKTGQIFTTIVSRDITQRKEREYELWLRKQEFQTLVENSRDVICRFDRNFRNIYMNPIIKTITGLSSDFYIGKTFQDAGMSDQDYSTWKQSLQQVLDTGKEVLHDFTFSNKRGVRYFQARLVPEFNDKGQVMTILGVIRDVTQIIEAERALTRFDSLHLIGEMAASLVHEVRNPLTTVRGYLQMFQHKDMYAHHKLQFETMIEELDRANLIITEFLLLAKNKTVEFELSNLNYCINMIFPLLQADAFRMGHGLTLELGNIPDIILDKKEIRQLLLNLVRNGLEACAPGGVITIRTNLVNDHVVLSVRDTGHGIPKCILDKLGTPFLTTKDTGTGLGIPVCYRIIERHKAKMDIETSSAGTSFHISFTCPLSKG